MKYYEWSKQHQKTIILLPGTCCNVKCNFIMSAAQISSFAKGLTPYPKWCWIFSMLVGMAATMLLKFAGNNTVANGRTAAWISIGNIWMFGGLLLSMKYAVCEESEHRGKTK